MTQGKRWEGGETSPLTGQCKTFGRLWDGVEKNEIDMYLYFAALHNALEWRSTAW